MKKPQPPDPNKASSADMSELFKALAHPDRVRLVEELSDEEKDVNTLCANLGVRQARVSQHLAVLRAGHVVSERRQGRRVLYRLAKPALAAWMFLGGMTLGIAPGAVEDTFVETSRMVEVEEEEEKKRGKR